MGLALHTQAVPLRADAKRNYDHLVATATAHFSEHGASASLEDIAKRAGVGIGTLYRHFPTRDDLICAVLMEGNNAIVARATDLLSSTMPATALYQWLRALVTHVTRYRGLAAAVAPSFVTEAGTKLCSTCTVIADAGEALLKRAQEAGEIRRDAEVKEVILTAHSAAWIAEQTKDPTAVDRLLGILFDGLRAMPPVEVSAPRARSARPPRPPTAPRSPARRPRVRSRRTG